MLLVHRPLPSSATTREGFFQAIKDAGGKRQRGGRTKELYGLPAFVSPESALKARRGVKTAPTRWKMLVAMK